MVSFDDGFCEWCHLMTVSASGVILGGILVSYEGG